MREIFRPTATALSIACLALAMSAVSSGGALAQAKQVAPKEAAPPAQQAAPPVAAEAPAIKQIALTEKQIEGVLVAQKEVDAIVDKLSDDPKPDPKVDAQLEAIVKKNGFAGYDEYNTVIDNLSLVLGGSARRPSSRPRLPRSRPTRKWRPRTRRKYLPNSTRR